MAALGELDGSLQLQGKQHIPAGSVFEPAVGLPPVPMPAQDLEDFGSSLIPVSVGELLYGFQFLRANKSILKREYRLFGFR